MKKLIIMVIILLAGQNAYAQDHWYDNWSVMGIDCKDFKGRSIPKIAGGIILSYAVHELGHIMFGNAMGMDAYYDFHDKVVYTEDYYGKSKDQKALFSAAGFITETVVGGVLTAIPATRHSDWTLGFTLMSTWDGFGYAITNGKRGGDVSDTQLLTDNGYNGRVVAFITGGINATFMYISLNKNK